jgi:hypothetical protein
MSDQNEGTQQEKKEKKGVNFPPQGSSEGSGPPNSNVATKWIKKKAEEGAKKHNPLLDVKGGS